MNTNIETLKELATRIDSKNASKIIVLAMSLGAILFVTQRALHALDDSTDKLIE